MNTKHIYSAVALFIFGSLITGASFAGSASANMGVQASVAASCSISTTALSFGTYEQTGANATTPLDSTSAVNVACTNGTVATITIDAGNNGTLLGLGAIRKMSDGGGTPNYLNYDLYQDAARTIAWAADDSVVDYTGTGSQDSLTVYGRIAAGQTPAAGSYSDTVNVQVDF